MLVVKDLRIDVGPVTLLDGVSFSLQPGDKVGLVGRNGAGKSTLMKTLMGMHSPAAGTISLSGEVGYFSQESEPPDLEDRRVTALERILAARQIGAMLRRIEDTRRQIEKSSGEELDRAIRRFARLQDEFEARGGFVAEAEAKRVAAALGIGDKELHQPVMTMSGGQRRRVELARILFAETDILLLDEPTNHLDLDAKAWLVDHLRTYRGGLLVVSHDLPLLDEAITSVLAVENGEVEAYKGNYSFFVEERERRRQQREKERRHQEAEIARLEGNIRRFKGRTARMSRVASTMETRVERIKRELVQVQKRGRGVKLRFPQPEPSGRTPVSAHGLAKAYDDNIVFVDVDVDTTRGERLVILGLNGAGKTTLLRILAGVEQPDLGRVALGHKATIGYYAQEHEQIEPGVTVLDHLRSVSDAPDQVLRTVLGHFLLAERVDQDAATLSGGEKTKLALAMLVMARPNVLLLDEPTNNLDPQAKDALLEALHQYQGTIILVSHDTDFVARLGPDRAILMPEGTSYHFDEEMLELVALA